MQVYLFMVVDMFVLFKSEGLWWLFLLDVQSKGSKNNMMIAKFHYKTLAS